MHAKLTILPLTWDIITQTHISETYLLSTLRIEYKISHYVKYRSVFARQSVASVLINFTVQQFMTTIPTHVKQSVPEDKNIPRCHQELSSLEVICENIHKQDGLNRVEAQGLNLMKTTLQRPFGHFEPLSGVSVSEAVELPTEERRSGNEKHSSTKAKNKGSRTVDPLPDQRAGFPASIRAVQDYFMPGSNVTTNTVAVVLYYSVSSFGMNGSDLRFLPRSVGRVLHGYKGLCHGSWALEVHHTSVLGQIYGASREEDCRECAPLAALPRRSPWCHHLPSVIHPSHIHLFCHQAVPLRGITGLPASPSPP